MPFNSKVASSHQFQMYAIVGQGYNTKMKYTKKIQWNGIETFNMVFFP